MKNTIGFIGLIGIAFIAVMITAVPVFLIWNHVLVDVFPAVNEITIWQALWLSVLSSCLFKSYSPRIKNS